MDIKDIVLILKIRILTVNHLIEDASTEQIHFYLGYKKALYDVKKEILESIKEEQQNLIMAKLDLQELEETNEDQD